VRITEFDGRIHCPPWHFWYRQLVMVGGLGIIFTGSGVAATVCGMNVSYSRKVCHLALFASSPIFLFLWPYLASSPSDARWATLWTVWTSFIPYYGFIKPIRRRSTIALLCFRAIDREEDRPHTLEWLVTQAVAGLATVVATMLYLSSTIRPGHPARLSLVMIPILINGLGDGLAEPVGIAWGRHKYTTRALWYQGRCCSGSFTRSLEGSATVLFFGVLVTGIFRTFFSVTQFAVAMATIPPALTLAEAFSPHTWDTPFIIGIGGLLLCLILQYVPGCGDACVERISFFGLHL
jgi:dolichol kinase